MNLLEGKFQGQGGVEIHWRCWTSERASDKATVVLVHGLGEHAGRYAHVARRLTEAGCAVYALDHRGHGKSAGKRAYVDRFANAVADIDQLVAMARKDRPSQPMIMLGHSMGGALALSHAIKHQQKLDALILSGPAVSLDGASSLMRSVAKFLSLLAPGLGIFAVDPALVSRDPDEVRRYAEDPLVMHDKVPARTVAEIVKFVEVLPALLPVLKLPLLIQHGSEDQLAGVSGSQAVIEQCSSADKTLKVYEGLYHEIYNELSEDRAVVLKDLCSWIASKA